MLGHLGQLGRAVVSLAKEVPTDCLADEKCQPAQSRLPQGYEVASSASPGQRSAHQQGLVANTGQAPAQNFNPAPRGAGHGRGVAEAHTLARVAAQKSEVSEHAVFCSSHDSSEKRKKTSVRSVVCSRCQMQGQTCYIEFSLCSNCSAATGRCMCCNADAYPTNGNLPQAAVEAKAVAAVRPQAAAHRQDSTSDDHLHARACFCAAHSTSDKRPKGIVRAVTCAVCQREGTSAYVDFHLCNGCSAELQRCTCCGVNCGLSALITHAPVSDQLVQSGAFYCTSHDTSLKRKKVPSRAVACESCNEAGQSAYAEFKLCSVCSGAQQRCMCCGMGKDSPVNPQPAIAAGNTDASLLKQPCAINGGAQRRSDDTPPAVSFHTEQSGMAPNANAVHSRTSSKSAPASVTSRPGDGVVPASLGPVETAHRCLPLESMEASQMSAPSASRSEMTNKGSTEVSNNRDEATSNIRVVTLQELRNPAAVVHEEQRKERASHGGPDTRVQQQIHPEMHGEQQVHPSMHGDTPVQPYAHQEQRVYPGQNEEKRFQPHFHQEQHVFPDGLGGQPMRPGVQEEQQLPPVFCSLHDASEKRRKDAVRTVECISCTRPIQTNYAEFKLCGNCSNTARRCQYCGSLCGSAGTDGAGASSPPKSEVPLLAAGRSVAFGPLQDYHEQKAPSDYSASGHTDSEFGEENAEEPTGPSGPAVLASTVSDYPEPPRVVCQKGHTMQAKVARELWNRAVPWHYRATCGRCKRAISTKDGRYHCKQCKFSVCMRCSAAVHNQADVHVEEGDELDMHEFSGLPLPGDLILCGPDKWGIHHVVLCAGEMAGSQDTDWLISCGIPKKTFNGCDLFSCQTVETSRYAQGVQVAWFRATSYFCRRRRDGAAWLIADVCDEKGDICHNDPPTPVKCLLHPLRASRGVPIFDTGCFNSAVQEALHASQHWGHVTAAKSMMASRERLRPEDYPDSASKEALVRELRTRWEFKPICASVAIIIWQRYFLLHATPVNGQPRIDRAARRILRWMPLYSDQTAPSMMVKALSESGWILRENLDA